MKNSVRIGSRGSALAVAQAKWIGKKLFDRHPSLKIEFIEIKTSGDKDQNSSLRMMGGKGVFVKEIEDALLKNEIDVAVHSLKDVPQILPAGLTLGPFPEREDSRDAVISRFGELLSELPRGSTVGTSSPRRRAQVARKFKGRYRLEDVRGNVETRLLKIQKGQYDAIILAVAGLKRLGLEKEITQILETTEMMPAPGQGCLALELRMDDGPMFELLEPLRHEPSDISARAERAFLQALGGNCLVPVGSSFLFVENELKMDAVLLSMDGQKEIHVQEQGPVEAPELVGAKCAGRLLFEGGAELMMEMEKAL